MVPCCPAAPALAELAAEELNQACARCLYSDDDDVIPVATDGSVKYCVGAWGVLLPSVQFEMAAGLSGEDQSSFRAELQAILMVMRALISACESGARLAATSRL